MLNRMHEILKRFGRSNTETKRSKFLEKTLVKSVDTYANGTTGYTVKAGSNAGKILKHTKTEKKEI
jgi:hypothetical protein